MPHRQVDATTLYRTQTICLVILTVIASAIALHYLQSVLLPFIIALFVVVGCQPVLGFLESRLRLNWFAAFIVTFLLGMVLLSAFLLIIWYSVHDLSHNASAYERRIDAVVGWVSLVLHDDETDPEDQPLTDDRSNDQESVEGDDESVPSDDQDDSNSGGSDPSSAEDEVAEDSSLDSEGLDVSNVESDDSTQNRIEALNSESNDSPEASNPDVASLLNIGNDFAQAVLIRIATSLTSLLSYATLVMIFVFFLLLGRASAHIHRPAIVDTIEEQVRSYIVLKTAISVLTGLVTTTVLWLFGIPLALVFGLLAFLLNYIPNIGPLICCLLPIPFLVLNSEISPVAAIIVFGLVCTIQFVSGNVVEPKVMGDLFDVSPIVLLLALMFFGLVWGIVGMFIATPLASIIKIILQENESTKPLADLMAGRWNDSTRRLAGDKSTSIEV